MTCRVFLLAFFALFWPHFALAAEQINDFDVDIEVRKSGDILVTEKIEVTSEGRQIRRGIFRDLPRGPIIYSVSGPFHLYAYKSFAVQDGELCFSLEPFARRSVPVGLNMVENKV